MKQKKRLIVCCDGTWQQLNSSYPSNVIKLAQAVKPMASDGVAQIVFYDEGIGADSYKLLGGVTGLGIDRNIQDAYRFLSLNYDSGDEIYLFGFSRGAYTVRSLAGMIYCSGLLDRPHITRASEAYELYRNRDIKPKDPIAANYRKDYGKDNGSASRLPCLVVSTPLEPLVFLFYPPSRSIKNCSKKGTNSTTPI